MFSIDISEFIGETSVYDKKEKLERALLQCHQKEEIHYLQISLIV